MKSLRVTLIVLSMMVLVVFLNACSKNNVENSNQNSQNSLSSVEEFDEWSEETQENKIPYPWEEAGAKKPSDYTWEEFNNLSAEHQIAFQNTFENVEEFDKWMNQAQTSERKFPWDEDGAKKPADYTWEEFNALTGEQQIAFQGTFESFEDFENWLNANEPR